MHKLALILFAALSLSAQNAYLVKDINSTNTKSPRSSNPSSFFRHGSRLYFAASTLQTGEELWSTDGTEAGTAMVANINPGSQPSSPSRFIVLNGNLIFSARDSRGDELWTTDGTAAGTRILADIHSGSSGPGDRAVVGGKLIFAAYEPVNGYELWITDGTPAGTRFFKDLTPGTNGSAPKAFVMMNGTLYFSAADSLWKSDGTEAGTIIVKSGVRPADLVVVGSRIFFDGYDEQSGTEPWVSNGTEAGTHRIKDIATGKDSSVSYNTYVPFGDRVFFTADSAEHDVEPWISDGTEAGTHMLLDIAPGEERAIDGLMAAVAGNRVVFAARTVYGGYDLWQTDGTSAGTTMLRDFTPGTGVGSINNLTALGDRVYFSASSATSSELWSTDGTVEGTRRVTEAGRWIGVGSRLVNIDGTLYFSGANRLNGYEPWKTDGTAEGTKMIANVARDAAPSSEPARFIVADDYLYFSAWDGSVDSVLDNGHSTFWRSDGTPEGTLEINEAIPGELIAVGRQLFFINPSPFGLWTTNGTPEGTVPATELRKRFREALSIRFVLGDKLLVFSDDALWSTTLTPGAPVVRLHAGNVAYFTELAGRALYFADEAGDFDSALRITDGTPEGTYVIRSFDGHSRNPITVMGGHGYFATSDNTETKIWKTDGTAAGTVVVKTVPGFYRAVAAGKLLFFRTADGGKLWVTDGTADGTRELPATPSGDLAAIGTSVVFANFQQPHGMEPWISDGTPEGTRLLRDIYEGTSGSAVDGMTAAGGFAYFYAFSQLAGGELWMTDGTAEGTTLATDIAPGNASSYPTDFTRAGERIFFAARPEATGDELWSIELPPGARIGVKDVRVAESDSGTIAARFTITLTSASAQPVTVEYATSDGTASASADYDSASGTLTFAPGETAKSFDVQVRGDAVMEGNETFLVTLRNASGAKIETSVAAAIIEDDDYTADLGLVIDFSSTRSSSDVLVDVTNSGPGTATNIDATMTAVPLNYEPHDCWRCPFLQLAPNERESAFGYWELGHQQYLTATVAAREPDPNPANNTVAWTTNGILAMDALHLAPGGNATVWLRLYTPLASFSVESSDPSVATVPASVTGPQSFAVHGVNVGRATIRVFTAQQTIGTIAVDVLAPGTKMRYPDALSLFGGDRVPYGNRTGIRLFGLAMAPFTGARPTGTITVTTNGVELARMQLAGDGSDRIVPYTLPAAFGKYSVTATYSGDENFLPVTGTWDVEWERTHADMNATATRHGTNVVVRVRVNASPLADPTGTIEVGTTTATLVPVGPGLSEAELTVPDPASETIVVRYLGDTHYLVRQTTVRITDPRRRSSRH